MTLKGQPDGQRDWVVNESTIQVTWAMRTDLGRRREINEDSAAATPPVFAVADGMGGHEAGEVASNCVVERLSELEDRSVSETEIATALRGAVADLIETGVDSGSGTTVTGIALLDDAHEGIVFNIGDSRVYLYRNDVVVQLTKDHSIVQELVDAGQLDADDAESHPHANVITRAVGFHDDPVPDTIQVAIHPGDRLLVCTDGLTKELTMFGLTHFLQQSSNPAEAADALVEAALGNGGRDNITVIVMAFDAEAAD